MLRAMEASEPNEDYKFNNVYTNEAITYSNWHRVEPNDAKTGRSVVGLIVHNNGWHGKWYDFYKAKVMSFKACSLLFFY